MARFTLRDFVPQRKCWYHRKLTPQQRRVWEALVDQCLIHGKGMVDTVRIGTQKLAHMLGMVRFSVQRIIYNFQDYGWLTPLENGPGRGKVAVRRLRPYGPIQRPLIHDDAEGCPEGEEPPWEKYEALADEMKTTRAKQALSSSCTKPEVPVPNRAAEAVGVPRKAGFSLQPEVLEVEEARASAFKELVAKGWLHDSEHQRLLWGGLIARAKRVATNACAFVAGVVRKGLWRVVCDDDIAAGRPRPAKARAPREGICTPGSPPGHGAAGERVEPKAEHGAWKWLMTKVAKDDTPKPLGSLLTRDLLAGMIGNHGQESPVRGSDPLGRSAREDASDRALPAFAQSEDLRQAARGGAGRQGVGAVPQVRRLPEASW